MFLSAGLLLFLSCGSDDTKDVSGEDGDVNSNQYLQVQPNGLNVPPRSLVNHSMRLNSVLPTDVCWNIRLSVMRFTLVSQKH